MCKRIELCRIRLTSAKTSISLRLNAFFSKNDVKCAITHYFALKIAFFAHYRFQRSESTGKRANALNYAKLGKLVLMEAFPCV